MPKSSTSTQKSAPATPSNTPATSRKAQPPSSSKEPSKLNSMAALLARDTGASIAEMVAATGWQQHSVRGAMAGTLKKKRGLIITSDKVDGIRRYRAAVAS